MPNSEEAGVKPGFKICSNPSCEQSNPQPFSAFHKYRRNKDGLRERCKACRCSDAKRYYDTKTQGKERRAFITPDAITYAYPDGEEPYAIIPLHGKYGDGKTAKVSLCDVKRVRQHRWYVDLYGYAYAVIGSSGRQWGSNCKLHRFVLDAPDGVPVDHEQNDTLDNRRSKLRLCNYSQNAANRRRQQSTQSRYKGVSNRDRCFLAQITYEYSCFHLGAYETEIEAAKAYDKAARYFFGEFASTNFEGSEAWSPEQIKREALFNRKARQVSWYHGVSRLSANRWRAFIIHEKARHNLGNFDTQEEAAKAVDEARASFGLPPVNFPEPR